MMESPDPALERSFRGHRDRVNAVAFNPNMKQLVTASDDAAVMVWHFRPTLRAFRFIGHKAAVLSVAVSLGLGVGPSDQNNSLFTNLLSTTLELTPRRSTSSTAALRPRQRAGLQGPRSRRG